MLSLTETVAAAGAAVSELPVAVPPSVVTFVPLPLNFMILFSISNQKGAPNEMANAVRSQPRNVSIPPTSYMKKLIEL
ncbi:MAG: hypothetical protein ABI581_09200, partial [Sediminibacterium sp.]